MKTLILSAFLALGATSAFSFPSWPPSFPYQGDPNNNNNNKDGKKGGAAPEFDFLLSGGAIAFISGGILVIRGRQKK